MPAIMSFEYSARHVLSLTSLPPASKLADSAHHSGCQSDLHYRRKPAAGAVQQTVTVEAAGELLQASTSEVGAVIAEKQVLDLPLNGRNFTQLLSLSPGRLLSACPKTQTDSVNVAPALRFSSRRLTARRTAATFS